MSDRIIGLGQSVEEYKIANGSATLGDVCTQIKCAAKENKRALVKLCDVDVDKRDLIVCGEEVAVMDDRAFEIVAKFFNIPVPYMKKLNLETKKANIDFWLDMYAEKEAMIVTSGKDLVDMRDGERIELVDVLFFLDSYFENAMVFRTARQTNATLIDVYCEDVVYDIGDREYFGGIRAVVKEGFFAPEISPILIGVESCGVVEFSDYFEQLSIKSLTIKDALRVIEERVKNCADAISSIVDICQKHYAGLIPNPQKRVARYCKEHSIPERVSVYAGDQIKNIQNGMSVGDIAALFSVLGYVGEVKLTSERKFQKLAGYISTQGYKEKRCVACDSIAIEG